MPMPLVEPEVEGCVAMVDGGVTDVDGTEVAGAELPGIVPVDSVDGWVTTEEDGTEELLLAPVPSLELPEFTSTEIKHNKSKKSTPMPTIINVE